MIELKAKEYKKLRILSISERTVRSFGARESWRML